QASRLVELPYSSFDDDDDGDTAEQDPGLWYPDPPKLSPFGRCVRYLAVLWNLLFLLLGLLTLAVGVWGLLTKSPVPGGERGVPLGSDPMLLFVLAGLGASSVSLAGCLGALRASPCLLRFFLGAVLAFGALEVLRDLLLLCLLRYQEDPDLQFLVDEVQQSLQCCGLESYRDWESNPYFNCSAPGARACGVPASCCRAPLQGGSVPNAHCGFGALALG
ncbi:TSN10 protein, partial [Dicaeum eximium]|nr:TSN10 protein [Dicaeum eximium]